MSAPPVPFKTRWRRAVGRSPAEWALNLLVVGLLVWVVVTALSWGVFSATAPWSEASVCAGKTGACWPFLTEKTPLILFGTFPYDERWRALSVSGVLLCLSAMTLFQAVSWPWQLLGWVLGVMGFMVFMGGGVAGLPVVPDTQWNGLPVLLFLGTVSLAAALPVGLVFALCRHASKPWLRVPATVVIETLRGIPMVAVLFFGVFVLPQLLDAFKPSAMHAALLVLVFFHAAYVAEDLRSGLQSVPRGQWEAAQALGLNHFQTMRLVVLPQAIKAATPALTNTAIGGFKDTSLIVLVGLHDLLSTARMAFAEVQWQAYALEAYALVGLLFMLLNGAIARAGRRLEKRGQWQV
jgi:general L-amino acid transport system permease protein